MRLLCFFVASIWLLIGCQEGSSPSAFNEVQTPTMVSTMLPGTLERVSIASDGAQLHNVNEYPSTGYPSISADGRWVAFQSAVNNLVAGDTNGVTDVFVHDRQTGSTELVSTIGDGTSAGGDSPSLSADGRWVAFQSAANNLVAGDTDGVTDIFVYDRQTDATGRVSLASNGIQSDAGSYSPSLSADGRWVAFESEASNLVANDTNKVRDIFVYDRQTGATERVSLASNGIQSNGESNSPRISANGRWVAFVSWANNLVTADTNDWSDIFVYDRQIGVIERVSIASDGAQANFLSEYPDISADGRWITFHSGASTLVANDTNDCGGDRNCVDVFVHDRQTGITERASVASDGTQGNNHSGTPNISADGRWVAFQSEANNLVADDTNRVGDVFVHDRQTGVTEQVSVTSEGTPGNGGSYSPSISADGRWVAFVSLASNLVADDTNEQADIFVYDRGERGKVTPGLPPAVKTGAQTPTVGPATVTVKSQIATIAPTSTTGPQPPAVVPTGSPVTIGTPDSPLDIPGFQIEAGKYCPHEVVLNPIPPIFEDHPGAIEFEALQTPEGAQASPEAAAGDITVRDLFRRALGDWLAFGIKDERGKYIAMRVGHPRRGSDLPSALSLEGVLASLAGAVTVRGPEQVITSPTGLTCFPPEMVEIREFPAISLRQEAEAPTAVLALNTVVWREGDMYWKLSAIAPGAQGGPYDLDYLLDTARNGLSQYDPISESWVEVR